MHPAGSAPRERVGAQTILRPHRERERVSQAPRTRRDLPSLVIDATTPVAPPRWALLERRLIDVQGAAIAEFYDRYFDDRGFLKCVPRWSGDDGPDDALENVLNWTVLHALGADDSIIGRYKHALEGHFQQYTEARSEEHTSELQSH